MNDIQVITNRWFVYIHKNTVVPHEIHITKNRVTEFLQYSK